MVNGYGVVWTDFEGVEDVIVKLNRPVTSYELVLLLKNVKGRRSVFSEIKTLLANGSLTRLAIPVKGFNEELTIYWRKK